MILNAIVATDRSNSIGNTERSDVVALPWKLKKEFEYFCSMIDSNRESTLLVCGPKVHAEFVGHGMIDYHYAIMSKSIKEKPDHCVILSSDYSFNELLTTVNNDYPVMPQSVIQVCRYSSSQDKFTRIIVLGGVPLYNTLMSS